MRNATKVWTGSLDEKDHSGDLAVDKRIILKLILRKYGRRL
jgi:hypothetical protein